VDLTRFVNLRQTDWGNHVEEMTLERYTLGKLTANLEAEIEEHILTCDPCRMRAEEQLAWVRGVKEALPMLPPDGKPERRRWSLRILVPAFATCALLVVTAVKIFPTRADAPAVIALYSMRGAETEANGPAGKSLLLKPDIGGLEEAPTYDIELVNDVGVRRWKGNIHNSGDQSSVIVPAQPAGVYFLRVYLHSGELLREYSLVLSRTN
jgi:hypothetical protein